MHIRKTKSPEERENLNTCDRRREISEETLEAAKCGDQEAFEKLYKNSYPRVSVTVKSVIRDQDSAQDVIQEVYLKAFRELKKLKSSAGFSAWIGRIAHNCAVNEAKKRKDIPLSELEDPGFAGTEPEDGDADHLPLKAVEHGEQKEEIRRVLNLLPPEQREVATLYYLEYFSVREITEYLGIPQNTVKSRLYYARRKLRDSVEALEKQGISLRSLPPFAFLAAVFSGEKAEAAGIGLQPAFVKAAVSAVAFGMVVCTASFTTADHLKAMPEHVYVEETQQDDGEETESETGEGIVEKTEQDGYANMLTTGLASLVDSARLFGSSIDRTMIRTVTFLNQMDGAPEDAVDVSYGKDGTVVAWVTAGEDELYDMYIAASGAVVAPLSCEQMFGYMTNLVSIDFGDSFDVSQSESTHYMFYNCTSLETLDVSNLDTSNVMDMAGMFGYCTSLENIRLGELVTSACINIEAMFYECSSLENMDVSGFDTVNVMTFDLAFAYCSSLTELDLSCFDTSNGTGFSKMFCGCESLRELDLTMFDTANAEDMGEMFTLCYALENVDVSSFDTSNVTSMDGMFYKCVSLTKLNLCNFNTAKVENMSYMFSWCTALESVKITEFQTESLTNINYMFFETPDTLKDEFRSWVEGIEPTGELETEDVFGSEEA